MKNKPLVKIILIIGFIVIVIASMEFCMARFIFLSPSCFSDNDNLTQQENYFIKKIVLEAVEDRLSFFGGTAEDIYDTTASENEVIRLDKTQTDRKHIFILINPDFMQSVEKDDDEYVVRVQTYYMESDFEDCVYEIHLSGDYLITFFGLDA